jgi:precorrin-6B methylase 2
VEILFSIWRARLLGKLRTFIHRPQAAINKYFHEKILREYLPFSGEDFDEHWLHTCFEGKTVLDVGADYGSTACYFLKKGAQRIVAVEGNPELFRLLKKHYGKSTRVLCVSKFIETPSDLEKLLRQYPSDIVKMDIEGAEQYLVNVDKQVLRLQGEWLVETHSPSILANVMKLFNELQLDVRKIDYPDSNSMVKVVQAK